MRLWPGVAPKTRPGTGQSQGEIPGSEKLEAVRMSRIRRPIQECVTLLQRHKRGTEHRWGLPQIFSWACAPQHRSLYAVLYSDWSPIRKQARSV